MLRDDLLRAKLTPPRRHRRLLTRLALVAKLQEALDYRLTLVHAGTGYGKSTALAALAEGPAPLFWLTLDESDTDPQRFLAYLIAAFQTRLPGLSDAPLAILQETEGGGGHAAWTRALDALLNALNEGLPQPALLVLDDYQFVADSPEIGALVDRFVHYLPAALHLLIAARHLPQLPGLITWRARGEVAEVSRGDLAFQPAEIAALFREVYGRPLTPPEVATLADKTEGWPIALQLVWQGLREGSATNVTELLAQGPASLGALFDYLARDVLERQPPEMAVFLRDTAVLRELTPAACAAVTGSAESAALLERLHNLDLFVVALNAAHFRYHHLFHDFLRAQLAADPAGARRLQRRAADYFAAQADLDAAIYHWLAAGAYAEAAAAMETAGEARLREGRLDTVALWIDALPPEAVAEHPQLQAYLGDVYRLRSRFNEALSWYAEAERTWRARGDPRGLGRALRGQALVYLDTVRPAQAESLLEEALRISDGLVDRTARARLLEMLAENKLNLGQPDQAERLRQEAQTLREEGPAEDVLGVRVKLRTGRLDEAQRSLEAWAATEQHAAAQGQRPPAPRAHRETVLLLSLIHAFRGEAAAAFDRARDGILLGERLGSPFITAVGHTRLGHAWQLRAGDPPQRAAAEAIQCYQAAIALGDQLSVRRMRLEVMWGLTRAYGFFGDLASAERAAAEGAELGRVTGDQWVTTLVQLALGASYVLAGQAEAGVEILNRALLAFRDCGDSFGRAAARLWLSLAYCELRQSERLTPCLEDLLALSEAQGYDFLFTALTFSGPPDPRRLVPVLLEARARRCRPAYVTRLLGQLGLSEIKVHPGYRLRVQVLGPFRVWRGAAEVEAREWRRDKARQLFQLLLTRPGRPWQRDEIVERLWPALSPEAAARDFKVALNALNKVLEPARPPEAPFAFIVREGALYRLRPEADLWLDAAAFEQAAEAGLRQLASGAPLAAIPQLQSALQLYGGDFLADALYESWASEERDRLAALYLRAADQLAQALIDQGQCDAGLQICQTLLTREAAWEHAYQLMMVAFARQGNRPQALRTYQRCVQTLRSELAVEPAPATVALHARIAQADEAALAQLRL